MKLINKFFLGICAIGLLTIVSCNKNDDDAPSVPSNPGILKGVLNPLDATGATSEWVATFTEAKHDTVSGEVRIKAQNAAGDEIMILLSSAEPKLYNLFQSTTNESTYKSSTIAAVATTRTNDVPDGSAPKPGKIQITDDGETDGRIKGIIHVIHWYIVGEGSGEGANDDERVAIFQTGEFDIPLTRGANMSGSGQANVSAKIDGAAFTPMDVTPFGFTLMATGIDHSITISLPNNATIGTHDFADMFSSYSVNYSSGLSMFNMEGTIELIEFNSIAGTATGTFEATATPSGGGDSVSITDGTFRF